MTSFSTTATLGLSNRKAIKLLHYLFKRCDDDDIGDDDDNNDDDEM